MQPVKFLLVNPESVKILKAIVTLDVLLTFINWKFTFNSINVCAIPKCNHDFRWMVPGFI